MTFTGDCLCVEMEIPLDYSNAEKNPIFGFFEMVFTWLQNIFAIKIQIGDYCEWLFTWLKDSFSFPLDYFSTSLDAVLQWTLEFLMAPPLLLLFIMLFAWVMEKTWRYRILLLTGLIALAIIDSFFTPLYNTILIAGFGITLVFYLITSRNLSKQLPRLLLGAVVLALTIITRLVNMDFWPPEATLILIFALLGWFMQERISVVVLVVVALLFIINQGYWQDTMETLSIVFWSCLICMFIGVSIGIYAAHHRHFYRFIQPILDLMQTIPSLVYLIPALMFFGIGMVPGMIATIIFVIPAPIRLTEIGIRTTPHILLEAGRAFGASPWQLLWKVELPSALPQIRAAMTQTIMLALSMVVIAAFVGGGGIGVKVVRALSTANLSLGFEAGLMIVVIAVLLDRMFRPGKTR